MSGFFRRWFREPLLHFLLIGAALFALSRWTSGPSPASGRIVVTRARIEQLAAGFERTWQRPPTERELTALVEDYIKEEVYVREAVATGLDRDDTIIRQRLRRKVELQNEEAVGVASPTDEDLRAFLKAHPESRGFQSGGVEAPPPELSEVRDSVEREWRAAQRKERSEALFRKLIARYKVVVEPPAETKPAAPVKKAP